MKFTLKILRSLIRETLYVASAPKRFNLPDVEVDADNTREAGEKAVEKYFKQHGVHGIDPFSVSLTPNSGKKKNMKFFHGMKLTPDQVEELAPGAIAAAAEQKVWINATTPVFELGNFYIGESLLDPDPNDPDSGGFVITDSDGDRWELYAEQLNWPDDDPPAWAWDGEENGWVDMSRP